MQKPVRIIVILFVLLPIAVTSIAQPTNGSLAVNRFDVTVPDRNLPMLKPASTDYLDHHLF